MDLNWYGRMVGQGMEFQLRGNLLCDGDSSLAERAEGLEGSIILHLMHNHYVCKYGGVSTAAAHNESCYCPQKCI